MPAHAPHLSVQQHIGTVPVDCRDPHLRCGLRRCRRPLVGYARWNTLQNPSTPLECPRLLWSALKASLDQCSCHVSTCHSNAQASDCMALLLNFKRLYLIQKALRLNASLQVPGMHILQPRNIIVQYCPHHPVAGTCYRAPVRLLLSSNCCTSMATSHVSVLQMCIGPFKWMGSYESSHLQ